MIESQGDFGIEYRCNVINDLPAEGLVWFGGNSIGKGNYCAPNWNWGLLFFILLYIGEDR